MRISVENFELRANSVSSRHLLTERKGTLSWQSSFFLFQCSVEVCKDMENQNRGLFWEDGWEGPANKYLG